MQFARLLQFTRKISKTNSLGFDVGDSPTNFFSKKHLNLMYKKMKTVFAVFMTLFAFSNSLSLPKDLKTCRRSDPNYGECLSNVVPAFVRSLRSGEKSLRILPIDPMVVDSIKIGETNSPVSVKQIYRNINIHGIATGLEGKNYKVDFDKLIISSVSTNPQVDFIADYEVNGQILVLPIHGKGRSNITLVDLTTTHTMYCETFVKDGETYLRIKEYKPKFEPKKVIMEFENLFNGDKALGDQMNLFLNENSELIFKELKSSFEESFGLVYAKVANDVLTKFPMNVLFPE